MMGGNVHAMAHRATAVSVACLATAAFVLCFVAGIGCNFVKLTAEPDRLLMTPDGKELENNVATTTPEAFFGVFCTTSPFFYEEDIMWKRAQIFLCTGLTLGAITTVIAWALCVCSVPTMTVWRSLSFFGAAAAVLIVPVFLIFESEACNMDINRQTCGLTTGAYLNMVSIIMFVILTLWTQLVPPPDWTQELNTWRQRSLNLEGREVKLEEISIPSGGGSHEGTEDETLPRDSPQSARRGDNEAPHTPVYRSCAEPRNLMEEEYPFPEISPEGEVVDDSNMKSGLATLVMDEYDESTVSGSIARPHSEGSKARSIWMSTSLFALASRPKKETQTESQKPKVAMDHPLEPEGSYPVRQNKVATQDSGTTSGNFQRMGYAHQGPALVNRDASLLSVSDESSAVSSAVALPKSDPRVVANNNVTNRSASDKKDRSLVAFSMAGLKKRFVRSPVEESPRIVKVSIICPDGTVEKKRLGSQEDDEEAPDDELANDKTHVVGSKNNAPPSRMAPADFAFTRSIPRAKSAMVTEEASSRGRVQSSPARTETVLNSEAPVELFSVEHSLSYDDSVSEMTPGPLEVREDTLAILQDLRRLEA